MKSGRITVTYNGENQGVVQSFQISDPDSEELVDILFSRVDHYRISNLQRLVDGRLQLTIEQLRGLKLENIFPYLLVLEGSDALTHAKNLRKFFSDQYGEEVVLAGVSEDAPF